MAGRRSTLIVVLLTILFLSTFTSLLTGPVVISPYRMARSLTGATDPLARTILLDLRLPRTLIAIFVGAILGLSGAALQGYLRNPLAEPSVVGASNGAAVGAVGAIYFGWAQWHIILLPLMAMSGAGIALVLLFILAGRSATPTALILAGIAISTLAGAAISLSLNLSPNPFAAMEIMTWLMGSIENRSMLHVIVVLPCVVVGGGLLVWHGHTLDVLTLGEDTARSLGADLARLRLHLLVAIAIGVGGAVAVSGAVGFIGLIVPHIVRPLTDGRPSTLLVPSAIGGAALLTLADILVRIIPTDSELRLGVVTAFLGVPVFLFHLLRERRMW